MNYKKMQTVDLKQVFDQESANNEAILNCNAEEIHNERALLNCHVGDHSSQESMSLSCESMSLDTCFDASTKLSGTLKDTADGASPPQGFQALPAPDTCPTSVTVVSAYPINGDDNEIYKGRNVFRTSSGEPSVTNAELISTDSAVVSLSVRSAIIAGEELSSQGTQVADSPDSSSTSLAAESVTSVITIVGMIAAAVVDRVAPLTGNANAEKLPSLGIQACASPDSGPAVPATMLDTSGLTNYVMDSEAVVSQSAQLIVNVTVEELSSKGNQVCNSPDFGPVFLAAQAVTNDLTNVGMNKATVVDYENSQKESSVLKTQLDDVERLLNSNQENLRSAVVEAIALLEDANNHRHIVIKVLRQPWLLQLKARELYLRGKLEEVEKKYGRSRIPRKEFVQVKAWCAELQTLPHCFYGNISLKDLTQHYERSPTGYNELAPPGCPKSAEAINAERELAMLSPEAVQAALVFEKILYTRHLWQGEYCGSWDFLENLQELMNENSGNSRYGRQEESGEGSALIAKTNNHNPIGATNQEGESVGDSVRVSQVDKEVSSACTPSPGATILTVVPLYMSGLPPRGSVTGEIN
jgi:hypothetical protein